MENLLHLFTIQCVCVCVYRTHYGIVRAGDGLKKKKKKGGVKGKKRETERKEEKKKPNLKEKEKTAGSEMIHR